MQPIRVPKFGSWEGEANFGYTTCFDSARKERAAAVKMNPNDPEENSEPFLRLKVDMEMRKAVRSGKPPLQSNSKVPPVKVNKSAVRVKSRSPQSFPSEYGREKSFITRSQAVGSKLENGNSIFQENHQVVATVPKFGSWDETDPRSGDGFSIIFNKVKQQKHTAPASLRPPHLEQHVYYNGQCRHGNSFFSKICCCRS